jgi:hypothetical protein
VNQRSDEKTIKVPQAKRTYTIDVHNDGKVTLVRTLRDKPNATATPLTTPEGMDMLRTLDRLLGP